MSKTDTARERMEAVVAPLVAALEEGLANDGKWEMPWHRADSNAFDAYNPVTDRSYTGGNRWVLAAEVLFGRAEGHWATYKQWASMSTHTAECDATMTTGKRGHETRPDCGDGCHVVNVRKGAKATYLFRPRKHTRTDEATGDKVTFVSGFSPFPVFDSSDVDGYEMPVPERPVLDLDTEADVAAAFDWAATTGAVVREHAHSGAYYSPGLDEVTMPAKDRWKTADGAWSTMAHELTHWTGHKTRLDRKLNTNFASDEYAFEELVAELGAAFTLAKLGRSAEPREDHARYLGSWLKALRADPKHLWKAAGAAEKASEFVLAAASTPLPEAVAA